MSIVFQNNCIDYMDCSFVQTRQQHILAVTLDPGGEWLACACLDGGVYLIPVIALTLVRPTCKYTQMYSGMHIAWCSILAEREERNPTQ